MTQENSKSSSNTAITTPSTFVRRTFVRRHARFLSWCVVPSVCMTLGLSSALAATNGTGNVHIPGGGKSSAPTGSVNQRDQAQKFILGATLAEWTQRFWSRFMAIPVNVGPANDKTGVQCGVLQSGPVWFLGGPLGGTNTLSCTIPAGKVILAPAATFFNDYPCPDPTFEPAAGQTIEDFLTQGVTPIVDSFSVAVELDGNPLKTDRVTAALQSFAGAKDISSIDACVTGSPQLAVADGKYAFIGPLSPGLHILHIHIDSPAFGSTDNTFRLTIK